MRLLEMRSHAAQVAALSQVKEQEESDGQTERNIRAILFFSRKRRSRREKGKEQANKQANKQSKQASLLSIVTIGAPAYEIPFFT